MGLQYPLTTASTLLRRPARPANRDRSSILVSGPLGGVIERGECDIRPVAAAERGKDQLIGETRVLREEAAVEVGADRIVVAGPFETIFRIVPEAADDTAEGRLVEGEVGAATVIFEANHLAEFGFEDDIADATVGDGTGVARLHVEHADPGDDTAGVVDVAVAEELESATNSEGGQAVVDCLTEGGSAGDKVIGDAALFAVLATPDDHDVGIRGVPLVADVDLDQLAGDASRLAAVAEGDEIAAIAVDVHHVRIEVGDADLHSQKDS